MKTLVYFFTILPLIFVNTTLTSQTHEFHEKNQIVVNSSFNLAGQIDLSNFGGDQDDTRLSYYLRLRGHKFLKRKFCVGLGLNYFDFYNKNLSLPDLKKNWNLEWYTRYYLKRKIYIEANFIYGGFARTTKAVLLNKNNLIGGLSLGFETKIKGNLFLELDLKTYYGIGANSWAGKIGTWGDGFLGLNYYLRN